MAYSSPNTGTFDQVTPLLRDLVSRMRDQIRDFEGMRADAETRERDPDLVDWCDSRIDAFLRQTARLEPGLSDPAYRAGSEFANALRWYQSLAHALDIDLSWSPLEAPTLARINAMHRLALQIIRLQEGSAAIAS